MKTFLCGFFLLLFFGGNTQKKINLNIQSENRVREAIISVPTKLPPAGGYPIVFMLHGTSGDADVFYNAKGWKELGQQENFITVFPSSLSWCFYDEGQIKHNTKFVCGDLLQNICIEDTSKLVNDLTFFKKVIQVIKDSVQVNSSKIFISGFSNGSVMTHRTAMYGTDVFSAAGGSSGPLHGIDSIQPVKRIPLWFMLGTLDDRYFSTLYPNELPFGGDTILGYLQSFLKRALACQGLTEKFKKITTNISHTYIWSECLPGKVCAPYIFTLNKNQDHQYPNGINYPVDAVKIFWEFFNNPPATTMTSSTDESLFSIPTKIYPNPVTDQLIIESGLEESKIWQVRIFDISGREVLSLKDNRMSKISVNINQLQEGFFMVLINHDEGSIKKSFIKAK